MAELSSGITKCRNCETKFELNVPLPVGAGLDKVPESERKLAALILRLGDHLAKHHKDINRVLEYRAAEFLGLLRILEFQTTEIELRKQLDLLRWTLLQKLIAVRLTDQTIAADSKVFAEQFVKALADSMIADFGGPVAFTPSLENRLRSTLELKVAELITNYRNMVEEPGKWVVNEPAAAAPAPAQKTA